MKLRGAITETKGYEVSGCSSQGNKIWHAQQFSCHTETLYLPTKEKKRKKKEKREKGKGRKEKGEGEGKEIKGEGEGENNNSITHGNLQPVFVCLITDKSFRAGTILVSLIKSFLFSA